MNADILSTEGLQDTVPRIHIALLAQYGNHKFKVGSDDDGYAVRLRMEQFLRYCHYQHHAGSDDSPLYIFDGTFADRSGSKGLTRQYQVPELFKEDLFKFVGERRRPPYRWLVMGPARSGSGLHVDPLATSAWNALLAGHKRWVLFPPGTPRELVLPKGVEREAVSWFSKVYPATQQPSWPAAKPITIIQSPGETVFVPHGWWHAVLNLDLTIAVTHNYVSTSNFPAVWRHARKGRPKMNSSASLLIKERLSLVATTTNTASDARRLLAADTANAVDSTSAVDNTQQWGPMGMGSFAQASAQADTGFGHVMPPGGGFGAAQASAFAGGMGGGMPGGSFANAHAMAGGMGGGGAGSWAGAQGHAMGGYHGGMMGGGGGSSTYSSAKSSTKTLSLGPYSVGKSSSSAESRTHSWGKRLLSAVTSAEPQHEVQAAHGSRKLLMRGSSSI
eukprot:gene5065-5306_t